MTPKFMFSTSNDILLLTISVCVAAFTIFACWAMFYLVAAIRNLYGITKDFKNLFKKVEEVIDVLKNKIHESTTYLTLFGEVLKKVMDVAHAFGDRRREKKEDVEPEEECDCEECDSKECQEEEKNASDIKPSKTRKIKVK
jgi:hypothetical protein